MGYLCVLPRHLILSVTVWQGESELSLRSMEEPPGLLNVAADFNMHNTSLAFLGGGGGYKRGD